MPPRESGPWPASLRSAIGPRFVGMNSGFYRHSRQQALQQWLSLVELDANRDALDHFGEIAGGIVGRQQRELRSTGRCYSLDAAMQLLVREGVDCDVDGLTWLNSRELRLLVGDHVHTWQRHDIDQIASDVDVVTCLNLPFTNDAIERCHDPGVTEPRPAWPWPPAGPPRAASWFRTTPRVGGAVPRSRPGSREHPPVRGRSLQWPVQAFAGCRLQSGSVTVPLLLLTGFDFLSERGNLLRLRLSNGRVLQLDLVGEIIQSRLRAGDAGLCLRDLRFVIGGIDLNQEIAGLDALKIVRRDDENLTSDPAAQPRRLGLDISVVRRLNYAPAAPAHPAQA